MVMWFLNSIARAVFGKSRLDPLAVSMSGVKLGDRLLVIGCSDPALIAALATKTGLTGRACAVDDAQERVNEAQTIAQREGALIEASVSPGHTLRFDDAAFDVIVVRNVLSSATPDVRPQQAAEALRVLRPGGRCLVIDGTARSGLGALFRSSRSGSAGAHEVVQALQAGGFAAVRALAEREGQVFVEGVKKNV